MPDVDRATLRRLLTTFITAMASQTHRELDDSFAALGLTEPPPPQGHSRSRAQRVGEVAAALPEGDLIGIAGCVLERGELQPAERIRIEDVLWAAGSPPEIPKRIRREIAARLDLADLVVDEHRFTAMLETLWPLEAPNPFEDLLRGSGPFSVPFGGPGLRAQIRQHVYRNPGDWSTDDLFEHLGAFEAGDRRFGRFLEALVSADVLIHEPNQRAVVDVINEGLRSCGLHLTETDIRDGYPVFSLSRHGAGAARRPRNLIFATHVRPDLRLHDALDNELESVADADAVLLYDRPIGPDGLRWNDLETWWTQTRPPLPGKTARQALFTRLRSAIPASSPPQQLLFRCFHDIFRDAVPELPALLPEVWLCWDPKTVRQRGAAALPRYRIDFLMLIGTHRVVLEVDGASHYADADNRPDPARYAARMAADRDLRLRGYDVFRFGAYELRDERARPMLADFFGDLFERCDFGRP
ncbi:MAG: hypothetical protein CK429_26835 [Mycobacterium sp.]|nr:MAG: hypothetical protein CK429_26835 [Mycobacterium sp.]